MTRKQTTTKNRKPSVKERGRHIVADAAGYDVDTRNAVARSLEKDSAEELADLVARAEAGEMLLDLAGVAEEYEEAARLILRVLEHEGTPAFLSAAMLTALDHAGARYELKPWRNGPEGDLDSGGVSAARLAQLFALTPLYRLDLTPKPDLAGHISAVLRDDETPEKIRGGILDAMTLYDEDVTDPAYIRLIIAAAKMSDNS